MKNKSKSEEHSPTTLRFSSMVGGVSPLVGEVISLNSKMGPFFMIGDIQLSEDRYWATISPDMPEEYYRILNSSLQEGYIVKGKDKINAVEKGEGILEAWSALISKEGHSKVSITAFRDLIKYGSEKNHSLVEIVDYCLNEERRGKNRAEAISLLEEVRLYSSKNAAYDAAVYDEVDGEDVEGKVAVTLVKTPDGPRILYEKPTKEAKKGSESASKLLDNALEA